MDSRQAREILTLYRPGTSDVLDPEMTEALEVVKRDAELAVWFDEHCAVYTAIRGKLKEIPIPPDLKRRIILENAAQFRVIPLSNIALLTLAAAAVVMLMAVLWSLLTPPAESTFAFYRNVMARSVQRGPYGMDMFTGQEKIRDYFRARGVTNYSLPKSLGQLPAKGAAIKEWQGHPVALLCLDGGEANDLYVFIINRTNLVNAPKSAEPEFNQVHNLLTASWAAGDKAYFLAGPGDAATLRKYLDSPTR